MTLPTFRGSFNDRGATRLLLILLCGDLVFVGLHLVNRYTDLLDVHRLLLTTDQGYSEMFQYLKYSWCALLLAVAAYKQSSWHPLAWVSFFLYFLLDDSLSIHEDLGRQISTGFGFQPVGGLRLQDYGEALVTLVAGLLLFAPLAWAYWRGSEQFRKLSRDLALLVVALAFFGVAVDFIQMTVRFDVGRTANFLLRMLEDCGELFVVSLMAWYVFLMFRRDFVSPVHLSDWVTRLPGFRRPS
jgi:hypothetical protein